MVRPPSGQHDSDQGGPHRRGDAPSRPCLPGRPRSGRRRCRDAAGRCRPGGCLQRHLVGRGDRAFFVSVSHPAASTDLLNRADKLICRHGRKIVVAVVVKAFAVLISRLFGGWGAGFVMRPWWSSWRGQGPVELAGDVALESAPDLLVGLAFGTVAGDVGPGGWAAAHPGGGDGVDRAVGRPIHSTATARRRCPAVTTAAELDHRPGRGRSAVSAAPVVAATVGLAVVLMRVLVPPLVRVLEPPLGVGVAALFDPRRIGLRDARRRVRVGRHRRLHHH